MLDIGWSELLVIAAVALVVVGPKDLPKLMRKAGQWVGRARGFTDQLRKSFDEMSRQAELDELRQEVNRLRSDMLDDTGNSPRILPSDVLSGAHKDEEPIARVDTPPALAAPAPPAPATAPQTPSPSRDGA
jgi:sec-independent protein translocase protein TatB